MSDELDNIKGAIATWNGLVTELKVTGGKYHPEVPMKQYARMEFMNGMFGDELSGYINPGLLYVMQQLPVIIKYCDAAIKADVENQPSGQPAESEAA